MKKIFLVTATLAMMVLCSPAMSADKQEIKRNGTKADAVSVDDQEKQARQARFEAGVEELKSGKKASRDQGEGDEAITSLPRDEIPGLVSDDND